MPDFSALGDLFGGLKDLFSGIAGFAGSVENPLPPFLQNAKK